jgi:transposase InsO family protein
MLLFFRNPSRCPKRPAAGLIYHCNRDSQCRSNRDSILVRWFNMTASMKGKGNCYHNAPVESFRGSSKRELARRQRYKTLN